MRAPTRALLCLGSRFSWIAFLLLVVPAHATLALTAQTEHGYYGTWAIAQSPSLLVSVGGGFDPSDNMPVGGVYTSLDGTTWTQRTSGTASVLHGITWSGAQFAAVGASGTVVTSPDGLNWTVRSSGTGEHLNGLLWSGAEFIAVGGAGSILASADGVSWAGRASGTSTALNAIARSPGRFVAVGEGGAIVSSADGLAWSAVASNTTRTLNGIAWSGSRFVVVGAAGVILSSPDGTTWTTESAGADASLFALHGVAWSGTKFVVVGNVVLVSSDGSAWTRNATTSGSIATSVLWTGSKFFAAGREIHSSPDGDTWTMQDTPRLGSIVQSMAWTGSTFYAVGDYGDSAFSSDGITWRRSLGPAGRRAVAWSPVASRFVSVGQTVAATGMAMSSADGVAWAYQPSGDTPGPLEGVIWAGSQFIAVGNVVLTSPDGIAWTNRITGANNLLKSVAWSGSMHVAVGFNILSSPDGVIWTNRASFPLNGPQLASVASSGARFVAVGGPNVMVSSDGISWSSQALPDQLSGVIWAKDRFVIATQGNRFYTSPDGTTWTSQAVPLSLVAGFAGAMAVSDDTLAIAGYGLYFTVPLPTINCDVLAAGDCDGDGVPNAVEPVEGLYPLQKDNDIFAAGAPGPRLFAMQQYRDFLSREGDPAGISGWTNLVASGSYSRLQVIDSFLLSDEFAGVISPVVRLYFATFLRVPDYAGLTFNGGLVRSGAVTLLQLADFFTASPEFQATYGALTNAQFVTLLYGNVLGRAPDQAGLDGWVSLLNGGYTRGQVLLGFSDSVEYKAAMAHEVFVTMMYAGMLRRTPEPGGFNAWVAFLDAGTYTREQVINGFFLSTEYRARFLP